MASKSADPHGMHDWHSTEYVDEWIGNDVTRDAQRRPSLREVATLLPFDRDAPVRVLDVGAGYGMLSREVLEEFPNAHVVLHDFSEPMLEQAKARLDEFADRVSEVQADLMESDWVDAFDGTFDAVVSSIAIHNVRSSSRIGQIYAEIFTLVNAGGCFYNIDLLSISGPMGARAHGLDPSRFAGNADEEPADLYRHLGWLDAAGFDEVDCLIRKGEGLPAALVAGFRSAP